MVRVVITDHDFDDLAVEREVLDGVADVVELADRPGVDVDPGDLVDADAVLNLRSTLSADHVDALSGCRVVARYGIGVDNVDLGAANDAGVPVTNVPDYCQEEVATHAVALLLALARGLGRYDASVAAGDWDRDVATPLHRLSTQTVGVVGYGAIGRAVGARAAALEASVVASDPFLSPDDLDDDPATLVEFDELLDRADYVTVHSPLTPETEGLFDASTFERMRDSAYLVNVARGPIVDDEALAAALDAGTLRGAALDVFPSEPPAADHPLRGHDRVVATPHVAWYSEEANTERRRTAATIVKRALAGESIPNVQNEPSA
ncbi:C-terminal binding protein [Halorarius litoreus]|uniref:C-terminal binding protein n=1 Tax=Halorarius litoreus TaxID=2962676 RepID=UPI0020CE9EF3|nr:C-terminal binding protein [Halorarius litoreus]